MKPKPINHPTVGGDIVDLRKPMPQRRPDKSMSGIQLLWKAVTGHYKPQTEQEKRTNEIKDILKK